VVVRVKSSEITLRRPKSATQARPSLFIRILVLGSGKLWCERVTAGLNTHPFEISVDYPLVVHIDQARSGVSQLR